VVLVLEEGAVLEVAGGGGETTGVLLEVVTVGVLVAGVETVGGCGMAVTARVLKLAILRPLAGLTHR
jgi:hypothetical protein